MESSADFFLGNSFIGSNIGIATRTAAGGSGHAYVHFMHNVVNGVYAGAAAPEQNNHLGFFTY